MRCDVNISFLPFRRDMEEVCLCVCVCVCVGGVGGGGGEYVSSVIFS